MEITAVKQPAYSSNPNWAQLPLFDRSKWEPVRFGDVVELVSDTSRNPEAEGITRFIGLEHLEPGSLHIKTWGELVDGVTFTKRCRKGQVLFGKRRAYQRKVAIAEFEALVSGDIYVFQAKDELLDPKLLPFICMSERFFQFAVETSAGSLSPRTNWSHLAEFKFTLPPLDQQRRISELLWAVDEVRSTGDATYEALAEMKKAALNEWTTKGRSKTLKAPKYMVLDDVVELSQYGLSLPLNDSGSHPVFRMMNYDEELVVANELKYIDATPEIVANYTVQKDDLLFNRTNSWELVGQVGFFKLEGEYLFASYLVRLRVKKEIILPQFLNYYLNSPEGQTKIRSYASRAIGQSNISASNLLKMEVPVPSLTVQQEAVEELNSLSGIKRQAREHSKVQSDLLMQLINATMN